MLLVTKGSGGIQQSDAAHFCCSDCHAEWTITKDQFLFDYNQEHIVAYCPCCQCSNKIDRITYQTPSSQEDETPDCSDCKHYRYYVGEAYCNKDKPEYPFDADLCLDFTHE